MYCIERAFESGLSLLYACVKYCCVDEDSDTSFESSGADKDSEAADVNAELTPKVLTEAEQFLQSEERRMAKREMIPGLCARLMENPEENVSCLKSAVQI